MLIQRPARTRFQGEVEGGRSHGVDLADDTLGITNRATGGGEPGGTKQMEGQGDTQGFKGPRRRWGSRRPRRSQRKEGA